MMWLTLEPSPTDNLTIKPLILARSDALVRFQCPLLGPKWTSLTRALMSACDPKRTLGHRNLTAIRQASSRLTANLTRRALYRPAALLVAILIAGS